MKNLLSPHVTIYKFPITATSSILTRLSGLYMSGVFVGSGISYLLDIQLYEHYRKLKRYQKRVINYSLMIPGTYHALGGIRHFIWDKYPNLLVNNKVARSSYILFGLTGINVFILEQYINETTNR